MATKRNDKTKTKVKNKKEKTAVTKTASARKTGKKTVKTKARVRQAVAAKRGGNAGKKKARKKSQLVGLETLEPKRPRGRSGAQAGDLEGLSRLERSDSESVTELLEEGNAFEAEAIAGVEAADFDEGEVHSHEVPEDDVPDEYLDKE